MIVAWVIAASLAAGPVQAGTGAAIELMVMREVTGDHAVAGAEVRLSVNRALTVDGGTIPYGTPAFGEVVRASRSGMAMHSGAIAIRLTRLVIEGRDVPISGGFAARGSGGEGDGVIKALFVPMYVLFSPGNVGKVKAGQIVEGHLPVGFALTATTPAP